MSAGASVLDDPDSIIAKEITIGSSKLSYMICYGLAPYVHSRLVRSVQKCNWFVICFDETMNRSLNEARWI